MNKTLLLLLLYTPFAFTMEMGSVAKRAHVVSDREQAAQLPKVVALWRLKNGGVGAPELKFTLAFNLIVRPCPTEDFLMLPEELQEYIAMVKELLKPYNCLKNLGLLASYMIDANPDAPFSATPVMTSMMHFLYNPADLMSGEMTFLMKAAADDKSDDLDLLKFMASKSGNIDQTNSFGETALMYAVSANNLPAVNYLLELNANIDAIDNKGRNPISLAVLNDNPNMLQVLLDKGADLMGNQEQGIPFMPGGAAYRLAERNHSWACQMLMKCHFSRLRDQGSL